MHVLRILKQGSAWSLLTLLLASGASAESPPIDIGALQRTDQAQRYELNLPNAALRAGGAAIVVNASAAAVRSIVMDFGAYEKFMPNFKRSRVISRKPGGTDVYLQVPILHGVMKIWTVARFAPPSLDEQGERIEGHKLDQGNLDDFRAIWHIKPIDAAHTLLRLELLVVPSFPVPHSLVTPALAESAENGVQACRARVQQLNQSP